VTLDAALSVPLAQRHQGRYVAWEVLDPAAVTRSAPHTLLGEAAVRERSLVYRCVGGGEEGR
jgi:hypothetical protein